MGKNVVIGGTCTLKPLLWIFAQMSRSGWLKMDCYILTLHLELT
jgi:hypothetical protein